MSDPTFVAGGASYLLPGDRVGCVLLHGFTAMPAELRPLADHLRCTGRTVVVGSFVEQLRNAHR